MKQKIPMQSPSENVEVSRKQKPQGRMEFSEADLKRFYAKVQKTEGCFLWMSAKSQTGYGRFNLNKINHSASRVAWTMEHGDIPAGMCVCHKCDNPACVRVDHLFLGTIRENILDCCKKGRHWNMKKKECKWGHLFNEENTKYYKNGQRYCLICLRANGRKKKLAKK